MSESRLAKLIKFKNHKDERGNLIALEENKEVPFTIKRMYYLYDSNQNSARAQHAHKDLKQLYIVVSGSCKVKIDNGLEKETIILDQPNCGILFEKPLWREVTDFTKDCVLIVLADDFYKKSDYINSYAEFLNYIQN